MYGLNLNATMEPALSLSGTSQVIFKSRMPQAELARYDLQVLEDDKQLLPTLSCLH